MTDGVKEAKELLKEFRFTGNQTLFLDVGSTVTVTRTYLNVVHETLEPEDIIFTVIRKPHSGRLQIEGKATSTFTQADVNKGRTDSEFASNDSKLSPRCEYQGRNMDLLSPMPWD